MKEFKINKFITLRLEERKTIIYLNNEKFRQCKYLLLEFDPREVKYLDEIQSIDEAAEKLDPSREWSVSDLSLIPPEVEFWGHCSNLQVWVEYGYDSRLLHRNLAFPLLNKLSEVGDVWARKVFRKEIIKRIDSGFPTVIRYLIGEGYLDYLTREEIEVLLKDPKIIEILMNKEAKKELKDFKNEDDFYDYDDYHGLHVALKQIKTVSLPYYKQLLINILESRNLRLYAYLKDISDYNEVLSTVEIAKILLVPAEFKIIEELVELREKKFRFSFSKLKGSGDIVIEKKHVVELNLNNCDLKSFPLQILNLTHLKVLWIENNELKSLPNQIEKLSKMTYLFLGYNKLSSIPNSIGKLQHLKKLRVYHNELDSLPKAIKKLKNLESFDVRYNNLKPLQKSAVLVKK